MAFPSAPTAGQTYTTPGGTTYIYSADGAWRIQATGGSGSTSVLTNNGDGSFLHNDGDGNTVTIDVPSEVAANIDASEASSLMNTLHDGVVTASAAEISALNGDEAVIVEIDSGDLREITLFDLVTASGVSGGVPASTTAIGSVITAGYNANGPTVNPGDTEAGSNLYFASGERVRYNDGTGETDPPNVGVGTWRLHGFLAGNDGPNNLSQSTATWIRIA